MTLRSRLERIERERPADGPCPGCGFRPDEPRSVILRRRGLPGADGPVSQPERARCPVCEGYMPPVATINVPSLEEYPPVRTAEE
jgi:hypothetical protein